MFITLVKRVTEMAQVYNKDSPLNEDDDGGGIPLVFDANAYPWCGNNLVPMFRLNVI